MGGWVGAWWDVTSSLAGTGGCRTAAGCRTHSSSSNQPAGDPNWTYVPLPPCTLLQLAKHRGVKTINVVRRAEQAAELLALG